MEEKPFLPTMFALWAQRSIDVERAIYGHLPNIAELLWTVTPGDWYAIKNLVDRIERSLGIQRVKTMPLLQGILQMYHLKYTP